MHGCSAGGTSCSYSGSNCGVSASSVSTPGISVSASFAGKSAFEKSSSGFLGYPFWLLFSFSLCLILDSWFFFLWVAITGLLTLNSKADARELGETIFDEKEPSRQLKHELNPNLGIYRLRRMF